MSFILNANQPISPERQKIAKAMLEKQQLDMLTGMGAPVPTNMGEGLAALGEGIATGLQMRSLKNQASAPTDAWGDMRQPGQSMATPSNMSMGFGRPLNLAGAVRRMFGG